MNTQTNTRNPDNFLEYWKKMTAPVRPSADMLTIYEKYATRYGKHQNGDWGLLGCTLEIRTLANKYNRSLCCIDIDPLPFTCFRPLCHPPEAERFVEGNWLEVDMPKAFDLVIGDGSIAMLPLALHQKFLGNLHRMLRKDGLVFLRIQTSDDCAFSCYEDVLAWHRKEHAPSNINSDTRAFLQILWRDLGTCSIKPQDFNDRIEQLYQDNVLTAEEYQSFKAAPMKLDVIYTTKETFEGLCAPHFEILDVTKPADFNCSQHYPIYALRKK